MSGQNPKVRQAGLQICARARSWLPPCRAWTGPVLARDPCVSPAALDGPSHAQPDAASSQSSSYPAPAVTKAPVGGTRPPSPAPPRALRADPCAARRCARGSCGATSCTRRTAIWSPCSCTTASTTTRCSSRRRAWLRRAARASLRRLCHALRRPCCVSLMIRQVIVMGVSTSHMSGVLVLRASLGCCAPQVPVSCALCRAQHAPQCRACKAEHGRGSSPARPAQPAMLEPCGADGGARCACAQVRAVVLPLPPQAAYASSARNSIRSRAWGTAVEGFSYRVRGGATLRRSRGPARAARAAGRKP